MSVSQKIECGERARIITPHIRLQVLNYQDKEGFIHAKSQSEAGAELRDLGGRDTAAKPRPLKAGAGRPQPAAADSLACVPCWHLLPSGALPAFSPRYPGTAVATWRPTGVTCPSEHAPSDP